MNIGNLRLFHITRLRANQMEVGAGEGWLDIDPNRPRGSMRNDRLGAETHPASRQAQAERLMLCNGLHSFVGNFYPEKNLYISGKSFPCCYQVNEHK